MNYILPYPYTLTIGLLLVINIWFLYRNWWNVDKRKYLYTMGFTLLFGIVQIHGLENLGNVPAWYFPKGSSYFQDMGYSFGHIIPEDILFIPCCSSLFYAFMYKIRNIKDVERPSSVVILLSLFLIVEAYLYQVGGEGCRILMVAYTLTPIILLLMIKFDFKSINKTHMILSFAFVVLFSSLWELFNAWRMHWIYDINCELFGEKGWVLNNKLHVSIFFQYAFSGFVVMYFCIIYYDSKRVANR